MRNQSRMNNCTGKFSDLQLLPMINKLSSQLKIAGFQKIGKLNAKNKVDLL